MNPRTNYPIPISRSFPAARRGVDETEQFLDFYGLGMGPAIEFSKLAIETGFCINTMVMDAYRHLFWFPFGLEYWFEAQEKAYACCMDFGAEWVKLWMPSTAPSGFTRRQPAPTPDEIVEQIEAEEEGLDAIVESYNNEILA